MQGDQYLLAVSSVWFVQKIFQDKFHFVRRAIDLSCLFVLARRPIHSILPMKWSSHFDVLINKQKLQVLVDLRACEDSLWTSVLFHW